MPRPMYFASFAKKVFLRAPGFRGYVAGTRRWCAGRVCGAQLVFCQRPDHGEWRHAASSGNKRTGEVGGAERDVRSYQNCGSNRPSCDPSPISARNHSTKGVQLWI